MQESRRGDKPLQARTKRRVVPEGTYPFFGTPTARKAARGSSAHDDAWPHREARRTNEIGIRKAVGATAHSVLAQFFVETVIIVAISGSLGLLLAYGVCSLVNSFPMPAFFAGLIPTWELAFLSLALLGVIAALAALYPASRAAAVDPIEALRYEAGS